MKTEITSKSIELFFALLVGAFLLLLPFQVWQGLFSATQTAKVLFLGWGVVIFCTIGVAYYFLNGKLEKITFTATDLAYGLLLLYVVIHIFWIRPVVLNPLFVLQWLALAAIYVVFRRIEGRHQLILMIFVMFAGAAQAIYGNLQLYGIYPSYHNLFKLTGSFFNPGPYSGYLVSVLPVAVGLYCINKSSNVRLFEQQSLKLFIVSVVKRVSIVLKVPNNRNNANNRNLSNLSIGATLIRIIAIITIVSIVLVLPAGRSRAAWLAAVFSSLYLLFAIKGKVTDLWYKLVGTGKRKWFYYILITVIALTITSGLYLMKKGSADGRLLIWKVTIDAIKEQPLWGHGIEKFKVFYMDGQAGYFKDHTDSPEIAVAGDNNYAFNEPLRIASETGLIGLALVLLVVWSAFRNEKTSQRKQDSNGLTLLSHAGLISIIVFGCFSYPAEIVPIMVNLILYLVIISGSQQPIFTVPIVAKLRNPLVRLIPFTALVAAAILASQQLDRIDEGYTKWNEAFTTYSMGAYEDATNEYECTYPLLKNNGDYLINYGKALSMAGKHEKAIEILEYSKAYLNNTILYTSLGDSYKATGQTTKAENAYLHAWQMVPSRFFPKYLLAKFYDETGQHEKAIAIARELLRKEVKIESTAVKEIQEEMRKIIEKQENTQNMFNPKEKGRKHNYQVPAASCPAPFSLRLTLGSSRAQCLVDAIPIARDLKKESEVM